MYKVKDNQISYFGLFETILASCKTKFMEYRNIIGGRSQTTLTIRGGYWVGSPKMFTFCQSL